MSLVKLSLVESVLHRETYQGGNGGDMGTGSGGGGVLRSAAEIRCIS